jgi:hypothetical protein
MIDGFEKVGTSAVSSEALSEEWVPRRSSDCSALAKARHACANNYRARTDAARRGLPALPYTPP